MPKKKNSRALQSKHKLPQQGFEDAENMDEEKLQEMKKKLIAEKPEFKHMFDSLEKMNENRVAQAQNSLAVFKNRRGKVTAELLEQFPNSPTAKTTLIALNHYKSAWHVLWSYNRPRVLLNSDCDFIQPGFHHFAEGYMLAQYMSQQFPRPPNFDTWVEDYLKLRPNDSLVEYLYVNIIVPRRAAEKSDYERCKDTIRACEIFVHKLLPYVTVETEKRIVINSYYMLAATYTSTDQDKRALDAFEKCFALDETNLEALYGIAFHHSEKDPEKALKLCNKYLDMAPKCDEKYPNTHYLIGTLYVQHFKDLKSAKKYYKLGLESEKFQLPFNPPTECTPKSLLKSIIPLADMKMPEKKELECLDLD